MSQSFVGPYGGKTAYVGKNFTTNIVPRQQVYLPKTPTSLNSSAAAPRPQLIRSVVPNATSGRPTIYVHKNFYTLGILISPLAAPIPVSGQLFPRPTKGLD